MKIVRLRIKYLVWIWSSTIFKSDQWKKSILSRKETLFYPPNRLNYTDILWKECRYFYPFLFALVFGAMRVVIVFVCVCGCCVGHEEDVSEEWGGELGEEVRRTKDLRIRLIPLEILLLRKFSNDVLNSIQLSLTFLCHYNKYVCMCTSMDTHTHTYPPH